MAIPNNPCGLSYNRTLQIIKDNVMTGKYNGRTEVLQGLLKDGFSYQEARTVTDTYFQIYRRLSKSNTTLKPNIILSAKEKLSKRLNSIGVDFLNGNLQGFPMTPADELELEKIYEKHSKADTPTLKEKYNEEASIFVQKFLPNYSYEIFKTSVYARPLLSAVFFIKSITSNAYQQLERSITDTIWDGKKLDFTSLSKFGGLANASALNVLKGGVPATSLYQSEVNVGTSKGRVEEFSIEGTDAADTKFKKAYYNTQRILSKFSNRFNAAPDTRGIFANAERHMYQLLKESYRQQGLTGAEAQQKALEDMELDNKDTAIRMAEAKFTELGLPFKSSNGKYTSEFNVAVGEYQRINRNQDIWGKALQLSKNDFWKKNMTIASEQGFGDYGVFGLKAQLLSALRNKLEGNTKSKAVAAFNLYAFGFLNGAANFAEDALERIPPYAMVKLAFLQARKGNVNDVELQNDISRRQRDIIIKNITTAVFFYVAKLAENLFCKDYAGKQSTQEISNGRTQIGVCGYPVVVPPQMMVAYKFYKIIDEATENDEDFMTTAGNVFPVITQANEIGLGGAIDKLTKNITDYSTALAKGQDVKAQEEKYKAVKNILRMGADVANSFVPLPSRLTAETGTLIQRIQGKSQKQQDLPFAIDEIGNSKDMLNTLGKITVASLGNVTGITEISAAAIAENKGYAVDWQGRKVIQFRGSDITGSGIQYTAADDILATAGVRTPYINRLEKINEESKSTEKLTSFTGKNVSKKETEIRYMTDEEYFNASVALGNFNRTYFKEKEAGIIKLVKEDKEFARKELKRLFDNSKAKAIEAINKGIKTPEAIEQYVTKNWDSKKKRTTNENVDNN
jgi:hypothetical protein